jgi:HD-GYP domain-containing protein (c-di-GMP phosphodiesterase class II)
MNIESKSPEQTSSYMLRRGTSNDALILNRFGQMVDQVQSRAALTQSVARAGHGFMRVLRPYLIYHNDIQISTDGQRRCFLNGTYTVVAERSMFSIINLLSNLDIPGLTFSGNWSDKSLKLLLEALHSTKNASTDANRLRRFTDHIRKIQIPAKVEIWFGQKETPPAPLLKDRSRADYHYNRLIALTEVTHNVVALGRSPDLYGRHIEESFRQIISSLGSPLYRQRLLAWTLAAVKCQDKLASHAVNVALYSILMSQLLGIPDSELVDLGFAAMFHDLGRIGQRTPVIKGQGKTDAAAFPAHIVKGCIRSLICRNYSNASLLRIILNHEHHRSVDQHPNSRGLRPTHIFSEIVGIADTFDHLQHGNPWQKRIGPATAMNYLMNNPERFSPAAIELLRDCMGTLPRGTLLKLSNGEFAVVVCGGARRGYQPICRRIRMANGQLDEEFTLIAIKDRDAEIKDVVEDWPSEEWRIALMA